jgi:hypothetical protein
MRMKLDITSQGVDVLLYADGRFFAHFPIFKYDSAVLCMLWPENIQISRLTNWNLDKEVE